MRPIESYRSIKVFISYTHADQELHKKLQEHLSSLKYSGEITIWHDLEILPGTNWEDQVHTHLHEADLILLLVSASFIASQYCWSKEVLAALNRHNTGTARVIPIILKPTDWQNTPLGQLQALPVEAKPITQWKDRDAALDNVARGIRAVVKDLRSRLQESEPRIVELPSLQLPPALPDRRVAQQRFPHLTQALIVVLCLAALLAGGTTGLVIIHQNYSNSSKQAINGNSPNISPSADASPATVTTAANTSPVTYFSPYQDVMLSDAPALQSVMRSTGQKFYTLAFVNNGGGRCNAEWAGLIPFNQTKKSLPHLDSDLRYIGSHGGDITISFGGAAGAQDDLARHCDDPINLQAQYQRVIKTYRVTHLDFDILAGNQADVTSYDRRNIAIARLQAANSHLVISFTLPATPTNGLLSDSLDLLQDAVKDGVKINLINLLMFDFGSPNNDMGQAAINGATIAFAQIKQIFPGLSDTQVWTMLGTTVMIGQDDFQGEILTEPQAQQFVNFARQMHMGYISFWQVSRDNGSCAGQNNVASYICSGLSQKNFDFVRMFMG